MSAGPLSASLNLRPPRGLPSQRNKNLPKPTISRLAGVSNAKLLPFTNTPPAMRVLSAGSACPNSLRPHPFQPRWQHAPTPGCRLAKSQPHRMVKKGTNVSTSKKILRSRSRSSSLRPGRPRRNALRGGDFYRPSPLNPLVSGRDTNMPHIALDTSETTEASASKECSEIDLEALLDDVFADMALNSVQEASNQIDTVEPADDYEYMETPPLAGWQYPDEHYEAERRRFSAVGGKTLDRTFIGRAVPEDLLSGVDSQL
ncbi:hypothetical protein HDU86_007006 [Geranomyces michiganensis]|nr:hypothetical protein HDU86_007006 [Geranomyces michiganensis]